MPNGLVDEPTNPGMPSFLCRLHEEKLNEHSTEIGHLKDLAHEFLGAVKSIKWVVIVATGVNALLAFWMKKG